MHSRLVRDRARTPVLAAAGLALLAAGYLLGAASAPGPAVQAAPSGELYVYLANVTQVPFWIDQKRALEAAGKYLGVRTEFTGPTTADAQAEAAALDQIIARRPAGIMVFPPDSKTLIPGINRAVDSGIPVITMIGDVPDSKRFTHIGIDNYKAGEEGARVLAATIGGRGKVVVGTFQAAGVLDRMRGYKDYLAKHYPGIQVVGVVDDHADPAYAPQAYAAAISAHPDLAGIGGTDGDSGAGAARAVIEAKKKGAIKIVAMDRNEDMLNYIQDGTITAAIAQKSYMETWLAVNLLYWLHHNIGPAQMLPDWKAAKIDPLPLDVDTGIMVITRDNVRQFRHATK